MPEGGGGGRQTTGEGLCAVSVPPPPQNTQTHLVQPRPCLGPVIPTFFFPQFLRSRMSRDVVVCADCRRKEVHRSQILPLSGPACASGSFIFSSDAFHVSSGHKLYMFLAHLCRAQERPCHTVVPLILPALAQGAGPGGYDRATQHGQVHPSASIESAGWTNQSPRLA